MSRTALLGKTLDASPSAFSEKKKGDGNHLTKRGASGACWAAPRGEPNPLDLGGAAVLPEGKNPEKVRLKMERGENVILSSFEEGKKGHFSFAEEGRGKAAGEKRLHWERVKRRDDNLPL